MRRWRLDPWGYTRAWWAGWRSRRLFLDVQTCVLFIGQPLGGTALAGALLNAHRHTCLAHELNLLAYLQQGYGRDPLFWLLYRRDRDFGRQGRRDGDYQFAVPGQWQGCFEQLRVIGDIKAGRSSDLLAARPEMLSQLRAVVGVPLRLFHVVRNPFHVIAAIHRRRLHLPLEWAIQRYFERCQSNERLLNDAKLHILTVHWERLLSAPRPTISEMCQHVDVTPDAAYLDACQLVVHEQARQPRPLQPSMIWSRRQADAILSRMEQFAFLRHYEFPQSQSTRSAA